jgi:predicted RNase H-related nuclease YkuK (DUF458 family)
MYKNRFKKFGGDHIPDIIEYLKEYIEKEPNITISVGCDSIQKRKRTIYACTIMLYNTDIKNGAHVVFFRESVEKVRDNFERLHKEAKYCLDIADFLNNELSDFYTRKDISEIERKRYKYHLDRCDGKHESIELHNIEKFIERISLSDYDKTKSYKLVDIHVDFNPVEGNLNEKGVSQNKSHVAYKAFVPWLRGFNYRVFSKPIAWAATSAADLLLQD